MPKNGKEFLKGHPSLVNNDMGRRSDALKKTSQLIEHFLQSKSESLLWRRAGGGNIGGIMEIVFGINN